MRIKPLETRAATSLVARMCYGTTSKLTDYSVLWMGEHLALVKWKGYTYQGCWHPATVWCMSISGYRPCPRGNGVSSRSFHGRVIGGSPFASTEGGRFRPIELEITRESPLTQAVLDELIAEAAARDHEWPEEMAAAREEAEAKHIREQERQVARKAVDEARRELLTAALNLREMRSPWREETIIEAANQYRTAIAAQEKLQEVSDDRRGPTLMEQYKAGLLGE